MEKENGIGVVGLEDFNYGDDADYHTLISDKIEPNIGVEFIKQIYQDKKILVVRINANKMLRPFVVKSKYTQNKNILDVGESWVRLGSSKKKMVRSDFENIYMRRRSPLGLRLRDNNLFINDLGIAQLELLITNTSDFDRVFTEAFLSIEDHNGKQLTILRMMKFTSR
jgi:predicted HTH transcriptional regulator